MNANDYIIKPTGRKTDREDDIPFGGLTARDHIAIEAMKAFIIGRCGYDHVNSFWQILRDTPDESFDLADAMIEKSNK